MEVIVQHEPLEVLVVEDCPDTASSLAFLLRYWGHVPVVTHDGPAALCQAAESMPDVVLLDVGMPGMDGWEVARRLRALPDGLAPLLIVMSGYCRPEDVEVSRLAGVHLHLAKPVDPEVLGYLLRYRQRGEEA